MALKYNQAMANQDETVLVKIEFKAAYKPNQTGIQFNNLLKGILGDHADSLSVCGIENKPGKHFVEFYGPARGFGEIQKLMSEMVDGDVEIVSLLSDETYKGKINPRSPWMPKS